MQTQLLLESLTFSDGTTISTIDTKIVAIVGPNNSGKSSALLEIQLGGVSAKNLGPVLRTVTFDKRGTAAELK
jgi:ABC-type cobalamin/Fe3+-siderophores transport system ATPase subunit